MTVEEARLIGRMRLEVRDAQGGLLAVRAVHNTAVRGGAELVARRLVGLDSVAIDHVSVGFGRESADVGATALTGPSQEGIDPAALSSPIAPADFTLVTDGPSAIVLSLASIFHPTVDLRDVSEAGLFGGDRLYNQ